MRQRTFTARVPLGRFYLSARVSVYASNAFTTGYASRVGPDGHVLTADLEEPTRIEDDTQRAMYEDALGLALAMIAERHGWVDAALLRTDKGFHVVSTTVTQTQGVVRFYTELAELEVAGSLKRDWRHLAIGLLHDSWTLRLAPKNERSSRVELIAYATTSHAHYWSRAHWALLDAISPEPLAHPHGPAIERPLTLVRYRV